MNGANFLASNTVLRRRIKDIVNAHARILSGLCWIPKPRPQMFHAIPLLKYEKIDTNPTLESTRSFVVKKQNKIEDKINSAD